VRQSGNPDFGQALLGAPQRDAIQSRDSQVFQHMFFLKAPKRLKEGVPLESLKFYKKYLN